MTCFCSIYSKMVTLPEVSLLSALHKKTGDKTLSLIAGRNEQVGARLRVVLPLIVLIIKVQRFVLQT